MIRSRVRLRPRVGEPEDFKPGQVVLTPSGRRAIVQRVLSGSSKRDIFDRIICRYEDGPARDLVTLQPQQLRHTYCLPQTPGQMCFDFLRSNDNSR